MSIFSVNSVQTFRKNSIVSKLNDFLKHNLLAEQLGIWPNHSLPRHLSWKFSLVLLHTMVKMSPFSEDFAFVGSVMSGHPTALSKSGKNFVIFGVKFSFCVLHKILFDLNQGTLGKFVCQYIVHLLRIHWHWQANTLKWILSENCIKLLQ